MKFAKTQGISGLNQIDGYVINDELASLKIYDQQRLLKQMIYTDSTVRGILRIYKSLLSKAKIELKAKQEDGKQIDAKAQQLFDFVNECLLDLEIPFKTNISSFYSFIWWGWSWHEILYKRRSGWSKDFKTRSKFTDGRIGWRKFDFRNQDSLEKWVFDEEDNVTALVQRGGENFAEYYVSRQKSIYLKTEPTNNKPSGESVLLGAVKDYLLKCEAQKTEQATMRRDVIGILKMGLPSEYFEPANKTKLDVFQKLIADIDSGKLAGFTLPTDVDSITKQPRFTAEALGIQGSKTYSSRDIIKGYDVAIALTLLADFIFLGHSATGTYELGKGKMTLLFESLENFLDIVCDELNSAVERLLILNGLDTELAPTFIHGKISELSLTELTPFLTLLQALGIQFSDEEKAWLKQLAMPKFEEKTK